MNPATDAIVAQIVPPGQSQFWTILGQLYLIFNPLILPAIVALMSWGVVVLRKHGFQNTYVDAIPRAFGAGVQAAQAKGVDPFSRDGQGIVIAAGAKYLQANVGTEAVKLGINTLADHADRVSAEMGTVVGKAIATAQASATAQEVTSNPGAQHP